ncbi:hypothetical protein EC33884_3370 [Escherichia coli 3.3884]|nr:hypothetical protein EC33884_3370 [Escherichia coli 3.3884]
MSSIFATLLIYLSDTEKHHDYLSIHLLCSQLSDWLISKQEQVQHGNTFIHLHINKNNYL